jgi:glycosyltransferase involved in cell wall biosynthesis
MYNCAPQIERVIAQVSSVADLIDVVLAIDNRSTDDTVTRAERALRETSVPWVLQQNRENYGLGGSHKVAIEYGLQNGFDWLLVLHGDDQATAGDIAPLVRAGQHEQSDALLGARFMPGSRLLGYSWVRTAGNRVYNRLFSLASRRRLYDLGSGLNMFRLERFTDGAFRRLPDDLTFNYHLTFLMVEGRWRISFFPISWRSEDQQSNVKLVRQGLKTLGIVGSFVRDRKAFLAADHSRAAGYPADVVAASATSSR